MCKSPQFLGGGGALLLAFEAQSLRSAPQWRPTASTSWERDSIHLSPLRVRTPHARCILPGAWGVCGGAQGTQRAAGFRGFEIQAMSRGRVQHQLVLPLPTFPALYRPKETSSQSVMVSSEGLEKAVPVVARGGERGWKCQKNLKALHVNPGYCGLQTPSLHGSRRRGHVLNQGGQPLGNGADT